MFTSHNIIIILFIFIFIILIIIIVAVVVRGVGGGGGSRPVYTVWGYNRGHGERSSANLYWRSGAMFQWNQGTNPLVRAGKTPPAAADSNLKTK